MQLAAVVIYDNAWWDDKSAEKDVKRMLGWLMGPHCFKPVTDAVVTEDGEYSGCQRRMAGGVLSTGIFILTILL